MIYFVQEASGHIKIGFTEGDPEDRVKALQTASPQPLTLLLAIEGTRQDETVLHNRFAAERICGEWFRPAPRLLQFIISQAAGQGAAKAFASSRPPVSATTFSRVFEATEATRDDGTECVMLCPVCGHDYTHPIGAWTLLGDDPWEAGIYAGTQAIGTTDWRRSAIVVAFSCESEHEFAIVVQQHKGNNFCRIEKDFESFMKSVSGGVQERLAKIASHRQERHQRSQER